MTGDADGGFEHLPGLQVASQELQIRSAATNSEHLPDGHRRLLRVHLGHPGTIAWIRKDQHPGTTMDHRGVQAQGTIAGAIFAEHRWGRHSLVQPLQTWHGVAVDAAAAAGTFQQALFGSEGGVLQLFQIVPGQSSICILEFQHLQQGI